MFVNQLEELRNKIKHLFKTKKSVCVCVCVLCVYLYIDFVSSVQIGSACKITSGGANLCIYMQARAHKKLFERGGGGGLRILHEVRTSNFFTGLPSASLESRTSPEKLMRGGGGGEGVIRHFFSS